jgi:hypothetical protein
VPEGVLKRNKLVKNNAIESYPNNYDNRVSFKGGGERLAHGEVYLGCSSQSPLVPCTACMDERSREKIHGVSTNLIFMQK